jgi:hypothetical protein
MVMKKPMILMSALSSAMFLSACTVTPAGPQNYQPPVQEKVTKVVMPVKKEAPKPELIKISGVGYGAESTFEGYTPGQRRLMAIRSAKLDAYRSLAEQLYGIKIDSNTSVATLTAQNDSFRARVNALVRGARIVSITPMSDNNYETVLEVYVDKSFFDNAFVYTHQEAKTTMTTDDLCQSLNCTGASDR